MNEPDRATQIRKILRYKGLYFVQQPQNVIDQWESSRFGQKIPPTLFAFYGGALLHENQVKARVDQMIKNNQHKYSPPIHELH